MKKITRYILTAVLAFWAVSCFGDNGYELWLNYKYIGDATLRSSYQNYFGSVEIPRCQYRESIADEFRKAAQIMLGQQVGFAKRLPRNGGIRFTVDKALDLPADGFTIKTAGNTILITGKSESGLLYGAFELIRLVQCHKNIDHCNIQEIPRLDIRVLNHWFDLNGRAEGAYGGAPLWKWDELPRPDPRYTDYARANASIGINGAVLNNVNADPKILSSEYLLKVKALADIFRAYNIKVYLSVNFSAPMKPSANPDRRKDWGGIGKLDTADPLDRDVIAWWGEKVKEIYSLIPDFGGFLVKANSEGMPGPQTYGRTHAQGANMLARVLRPYGGIVMWRAFVYNAATDGDRAKRSYAEFKPLDGEFDENVILQVKNGPIDFQPREPVHPLFGAMPRTNMIPELQIVQGYLGESTYLVYLIDQWREFFAFDTYCRGEGSTVARLVEGSIYPQKYKAIAGVANVGSKTNWCGHHFAQANWYAFGRLAWDNRYPGDKITDEWIAMTWNCDSATAQVIKSMMTPTWESFVSSHTPYAIGLTTNPRGNYYPGFYHRAGKFWQADASGIGSDRSSRGSDYVSQYFEPNRSMYDDPDTCPENVLLFFHFVPWDHKMRSGKSLKEELLEGFGRDMELTERNMELWRLIEDRIDSQRYNEVMRKFNLQRIDARVFFEAAKKFIDDYSN